MVTITERFDLKENKKQISESSLNSSFSSNNSFYEKLSIETKKDIIFLIKSGYDKKMIIKLYIFLNPSNVNEAIHYLSKDNGIYHVKFVEKQKINILIIVIIHFQIFHFLIIINAQKLIKQI